MNYPLPSFHFEVEFGGNRLQFSEVSGLDVEVQAIEYREGNSPEFKPMKMPGLRKYSNLVLSRGMVKGDNDFYLWIQSVLGGRVERRDIVVRLLDNEHQPIFAWKFKNAFPVKYVGPTLKGTGNEIAIETLEITHEGFTLEAL